MTGDRQDLTPLDEIRARCQAALESSPADETELVWIERRLEQVRLGGEGEAHGSRPRTASACAGPMVEREILVRIEERGRVGTHRTGAGDPAALEQAIRGALAQARVHSKLPGLPHLPHDETAAPFDPASIHDPHLAALSRAGAEEVLRASGADAGRLAWLEGRVVVAHRVGLERAAAPTAVTLALSVGRGPGAGRAAASTRSLASLPVAATLDRARRTAALAGEGSAAEGITDLETGDSTLPLLLSPEASAEIIGAFARTAFAAHAYRDGTSLVREHLGHQVFDRSLTLRDDGLDPAGLPFGFDLEGTVKRPVDLLRDGAPKTPCLDQRHAALLGLPATAHAVGGDDALPWHPHLLAGEGSPEDLLRLAEGGLQVGRLVDLRWQDEKRLHFRVRLAGLRRIAGGALGAPVADLIWESSLPRAFARVLGLGRDRVTLANGPDQGLFGATVAPALALPAAGSLRHAAV